MKKIIIVTFSILFLTQYAYATASGPSNQSIEQLNNQLQTQLKQLQAQQQEQVTTLNSQLQNQIKQVQTQLEEQIQKLNTQTQAQIQQVQTTLQQQIKEVQQEVIQAQAVKK
ncbi:hypothetical protein [Legionella fairfieldensis]|uniref:hypothetical protein n=1 Tax=Legionella fairfieldensis TaxID=45064 RepID=UPI00048E4731|nr:hypothetical protein [Legionella fairfieldensis]